jgi:hypothetical protein
MKLAVGLKMMLDGAYAKSIEQMLSKSTPLSHEDIRVINEASFMPIVMLGALDQACSNPALLPILHRHLSNHTFIESLNVLSSVSKNQRTQAQRAFVQDCIKVLQDHNDPSLEIFQKTLHQLA